MKQLIISTSLNGENTFSVPESDSIAIATLGAEQVISVPAGANFAVFSSTVDFFMKINGTCTVPTVASLTPNATNPEVNPGTRSVQAGQAIHLNGASGIVSVAFYA